MKMNHQYPGLSSDNSKHASNLLSREQTMAPENNTDNSDVQRPRNRAPLYWVQLAAIALGFVLLFLFYVDGLAANPPGFYVDESAIAYNAYCIAKTGKNEFGTRLPLFFP